VLPATILLTEPRSFVRMVQWGHPSKPAADRTAAIGHNGYFRTK
jgi:hypothetical protein